MEQAIAIRSQFRCGTGTASAEGEMARKIEVREKSVVDEAAEVDRLWSIYDAAFAPLRAATPMRHGGYERAEFEDLLRDPDFRKFVAYVEGSVAGLCVITTRLDKVPWVSRPYYAQRFPELAERGKVFFLTGVVIHPAYQSTRRVGAVLLAKAVRSLGEEGVLCADYSENLRSGLRPFVERTLGRAAVEVVLDRQVFVAYAYRKKNSEL